MQRSRNLCIKTRSLVVFSDFVSSGCREKKKQSNSLCVDKFCALQFFFFDLLQLILIVVNTRFDLSVFQSSDIESAVYFMWNYHWVRTSNQKKKTKKLSKEKTHIERKEEEEDEKKERKRKNNIHHCVMNAVYIVHNISSESFSFRSS